MCSGILEKIDINVANILTTGIKNKFDVTTITLETTFGSRFEMCSRRSKINSVYLVLW
jgi:hypothetical protein